jgi:hypothetical protein
MRLLFGGNLIRLALGYKGDMIKRYFLDFYTLARILPSTWNTARFTRFGRIMGKSGRCI